MSSKKRKAQKFLLRSFRVSSGVTSDAVCDFLEALDCPRALTVYLLYRYGEHQQLVDLECIPSNYRDMVSFRDSYAATEFLSKAKFLELDRDLKKVALSKFDEIENRCRNINSRFSALEFDPQFTGSTVWLLNAVTRKISSVLGEFNFEEFADAANWGPGATTLIQSRGASSTNKFQLEAGITRDLYQLIPLDLLRRAYPLWSEHLEQRGDFPLFQVGNKLTTVPKNAKTDRVIAIEPGFNLWFQKAIGTMIRRRLLRHGIDLNSQEVNQRLARSSSKGNHLATVDFSSASDSISRELVREILPPRWFSILDACRSHYGIRDGKPVHWEKFSSMGNGFTFELESLIFFAAASAVRDYLNSRYQLNGGFRVSVFGDDVVIPSACISLFSSFCDFLGFEVNRKKSHSDSPFRESCGSHFWEGVDVKPIYLKEVIQRVPSVYRLANAVRYLSHRRCVTHTYGCCDKSFRRCWIRLFRSVPKTLRFKVPYGLGDGGFIVNFDEATPVRAKHGIEGYYVKHVTTPGVSRRSEEIGLLLARLRDPSVQEHGNTYVLRGRTRLQITRSLVARWYDLGPWI